MFPEKGLGGYTTWTDAPDNTSYNGSGDDHDADDAEVFLGLVGTINLGFEAKL